MVYPEHFEYKIGFNKIREHLLSLCKTSVGKEVCSLMGFISNKESLLPLLNQTKEYIELINKNLLFYFDEYPDLREELRRLKLPGTFPEAEVLSDFRHTYTGIVLLYDTLKKYSQSNDLPSLSKLLDRTEIYPHVLQETNRIVGENGEIKDDASVGLKKIRTELSRRKATVDGIINRILKSAIIEAIVPPDTQLTIRNGRLVIPVPSSNKRRIKGFVHYESATGQTAYIEPAEVLEVNNLIQELIAEEKREIIRILTTFADYIRPYIDELIRSWEFLGELDFIRAKALLSFKIKASVPSVLDVHEIKLQSAFHPVLFLSNQSKGLPTIPFCVEFSDERRIMVLSGPNAGGKSVCMKTIGLLQYMLQCGLPVSANPTSEMRLFKKIFLIIGDEQDIENDLSTYSSHLTSLKYLLDNADEELLFLIDEFGSGTDPLMGGAIAEAVLDTLAKSGSWGVVTTHYPNLKQLAGNTFGLFNAAMLFEMNTLKPLFELDTGRQGSSFALEIAEKIGFPTDVLENAKKIAGEDAVRFEKRLNDLSIQLLQFTKKQEELQEKEALLERLISEYQKLKANHLTVKNNLEKKKKEIIEDAHKKAAEIIENANRLIELTIKEIRTQAKKNNKEKINELRRKLQEEQLQHEKEAALNTTETKPEEIDEDAALPLKIGDSVRMTGNNVVGILEAINEDEAVVQFGSLRAFVALDKLERVNKKDAEELKKTGSRQLSSEMMRRHSQFKPEIDIRGKRAEDAVKEIQKFLDEAILLGFGDLRIIHGKGNGILRRITREEARKYKEVERIMDEAEERGGTGVSLVYLRKES